MFNYSLNSCARVTAPARKDLVARKGQFEPMEKLPVAVMDCDEPALVMQLALPAMARLHIRRGGLRASCRSGKLCSPEVGHRLVESRKCDANKQQTLRRG